MGQNHDHKCTADDVVQCNRPQFDDDGGVSFTVTCHICGKAYQKVYWPNDGLWDPTAEKYVSLTANE